MHGISLGSDTKWLLVKTCTYMQPSIYPVVISVFSYKQPQRQQENRLHNPRLRQQSNQPYLKMTRQIL